MGDVLKLTFRVNDEGTPELVNIGKHADRADRAFRKLGQTTKNTGGVFKKAMMFAKQNVLALGAAVGVSALAVATGFRRMMASTAQFEQKWKEVTTLLGRHSISEAFGRTEREMQTAILRMAGHLGSARELTESLYQAISAGVDKKNALVFVEQAAMLAKAGLADLNTTTKLLASTMNVYGVAAEDASKVSDVLFKVVEQGITTLPELVGSFGRVTVFAEKAGVSLEDLGASIALLTSRGLQTEVATTALRSMFATFIKPTDDAKKAAQEFGIELSTTAIKAKGWRTVLEELIVATDGNIEKLAQLFPELRSIAAAGNLAGLSVDELRAKFGEFANTQGTTKTAFERANEAILAQWDALKNKLDAALIQVGLSVKEKMLPTLKRFSDWLDDDGADSIVNFAGAIGGLITAIGDLISGLNTLTLDVIPKYLGMVGRAITLTGEWRNITKENKEAAKATADSYNEAWKFMETNKTRLLAASVGMGGRGLKELFGETGVDESTIRGLRDVALARSKMTNTLEGERQAWGQLARAINDYFTTPTPAAEKKQADKLNMIRKQRAAVEAQIKQFRADMAKDRASNIKPFKELDFTENLDATNLLASLGIQDSVDAAIGTIEAELFGLADSFNDEPLLPWDDILSPEQHAVENAKKELADFHKSLTYTAKDAWLDLGHTVTDIFRQWGQDTIGFGDLAMGVLGTVQGIFKKWQSVQPMEKGFGAFLKEAGGLFRNQEGKLGGKGASIYGMAGSLFGGLMGSDSGTKQTIGRIGSYAAMGGQLAGPWGAAAGAIAGAAESALRKVFGWGKPRWKKVTEEFANKFGLNLSKDVAKAVAESAKALGSTAKGFVANFGAVLAEQDLSTSGGLTTFLTTSLSQFAGAKASAEEYSALLGEMMPRMIEFGEVGSDAWKQMMDQAKGAGVETDKFLREHIGPMLEKTVEGITKLWGSFKTVGATNMEMFERIGMETFDALIANGYSFNEAMDLLGGHIDNLAARYEELGQTGGDSFQELAKFREIAETNQNLFDRLEGVNTIMENLSKSGALTTETFRDMQRVAYNTFTNLVTAGLTEEQTLQQMLPTLRSMQDAHDRLGMPISQNTQKMIDQAKELGLLKGSGDQLVDSMNLLTVTIADAFGVRIPAAIRKSVDELWNMNNAAGSLGNSLANVHLPGGGSGGGKGKLPPKHHMGLGGEGFQPPPGFAEGFALLRKGEGVTTPEGRGGGGAQPIIMHHQTILDGKVIDERVEQVTQGNFNHKRHRIDPSMLSEGL